jgi:hypothetical protein
LTEAGRLKVRWILITGPQQHRLVYVHVAERTEETAARLAAVQQLACQISPSEVPPVMLTTIADDDSPADRADAVGRKFQSSMPPPRLPAGSDGGGAAGGGGGGGGGGK